MRNVVIPFYHPFLMTACGPTQSGKTFFIKEIIKNCDKLIEPSPKKLIYLYTCYQPIYDEIIKVIEERKDFSSLKKYEFIDCSSGIPSVEQLKEKLDEDKRTLLILDDLMVIATDHKENLTNLNNIASRDSHHYGMSVIFVCQNLNYGSGKLRNVRVNSQYHLMFKNLADVRNLEMIGSNKKIPYAKMRKISDVCMGSRQYGYVLFDSNPKSFTNARIRTGILPEDDTIVFDTECI